MENPSSQITKKKHIKALEQYLVTWNRIYLHLPKERKLDDQKDIILFDEAKWQEKSCSDLVEEKEELNTSNLNASSS